MVAICLRAEPSDPAFGMTYGESGLGKSTDTAATFPTALGICRKGGLLPASSFLGLRTELGTNPIREVEVKTLVDVIRLVAVARDKGFSAVLIDDLTMIANDTMPVLEARYGADSWDRWAAFQRLIVKLRAVARHASVHVWINAHPRAPWLDKKSGEWQDGGPMLPSRNQTKTIPHEVDMGFRIVEGPDRLGDSRAARAVYDCGSTAGWWTKDRHNAAPSRGPANLRAILVTAGFRLARAPGLEWQDQVMLQGAEKLLTSVCPGAHDEALAMEYGAELFDRLLRAGKHEDHIMWAIRDTFALAEIQRTLKQRAFERFFHRRSQPEDDRQEAGLL